ncbi:MAG: MBG domain-containing protein [Subdoligranulum sp.]|nr:MBG domain-containing protein [Subdoligranulum sp.]
MNLKYKLISFVTSLALIGTMSANALAEKPSKSAAVAQPNITLTTSTPNIQLGQSVEIALSIDAQKEGFAGLSAVVGCAQAGLTPAKVSSSISDDVKQSFSDVTLPEKTGNTFSGLVLYGKQLQKIQLTSAVVYTFTAEKVGTYTVSVSGDYSDTSGNSTLYNAVSPLTITVSAKALTASVNNSAMLTGTYGDAPSTLATHITKDMVSFSDNGKVVSVDGTWTYAGEAGSYPTVGTQKAAFLFTPNDKAQYAPLTVEIPVKITPKELTAELSVANASKQYDGTKKLPEGNLAVELNGSVSSDKLTATIQGTPEYDSANVGENIAIKATYKVSGSNLDCYTLGDQTLSADAEYTAEASGSITPYTGVVTVSENFDTRSYNGQEQPLKPQELTLKDSYGNELTAGTDYEVTYPDGCRGSGDKDTTVSYKLTGLNNYGKDCTFSGGKGSFEIKQLPMPVATGKLDDVTVDYNTPFEIKTDAIRLSDGNGNTVAGNLQLRYKAEGGEWTDAKPELPGTYTVGVYFDSNDKNAYASGMLNGISTTLTIQKAEGSGTVNMEDYTYGDDTPAPVPTSTTNGTADVSYRYTGDHYDSDKAPVNAGNYTVTATFKATEIYNEAAATDSFTVSPKKLTDNDVKFSSAEFTYNGEVQKPELQTSLTAEDYSAVYSDESSKIVGSYTVTVTGKGNYTGSVTCTYTIIKANGSGSVTMADYTYGDKAPAPVATSATNGTAGVSYTYESRDGTTYAKNETAPTHVGNYTVTAHFAETATHKACTATADFSITPKSIVADDFTLNATEFTYNSSEQKPAVLAAEGRKMVEGTDYTVKSPDASTNAGSYKVTVTGQGNYTGSVELSYKILPAVYELPEGAKITTELAEYPLSIYGGQPLSHIGLKAEGLPEGAQFGWSAEDRDKTLGAGTVSYKITVDPNDPNYSEGTATVSVKLVNAVAPADSKEGITGQLSTVAASISKTASENGKLSAGAAKDIAQLTLSGKLTPKEQDDLKSAHLSDTALLAALDESAENVTVSTQLNKGEKSALTGLAITTGGKAALGADNDTTAYTATYTAKDITPEKPADGQLIEVELSLGSGQQPAVPVLVSLSFHAKNADPNGKFQVVHKHTETDASKNFTTQYDCRSVSKSGDTVTVQFLAASFSSFSIQYTAPASGGSSSSSSATPKPDEPQPQPTATPALTASETTWLGGYGALLNAKSGTALSLDVTACEYLPGYIITGVQKSGVTLNLSTPAGKLCLSPAVAKAMNGSYNYTFADALAISGKVAAAAKPAASPAPVKDPTAASPTPAPTPVPTAAPQPTQAPAPQPEAEPQEKSHSPLPMVAAVLVAAALLAGGYLAYNSASRRKALHDVYAPSKKVKLNQNQNNGRNRE